MIILLIIFSVIIIAIFLLFIYCALVLAKRSDEAFYKDKG